MRSYFGNPPGPNAWVWLETTADAGRSSGLMMVNFVAPVLAPHLRPEPDLCGYILAMRGAPNELFENGHIAKASQLITTQLEYDPVLKTVNQFC